MKKSTIRVLPVLFVTLTLISACSKFQAYFPDKEKDYHYSEEIPELVLPPDIAKHSLDLQTNPPLHQGEQLANTEVQEETLQPVTETDMVRMLVFDGGATRIQIDESFTKSWRRVGKALSHNSIEIIDRNSTIGTYFVLYDPNKQSYEDGSLWDEVKFFFNDDQNQEEEYHIRLAATDQLTEVLVTDAAEIPLSEGPGLSLLTQLYETIKADFEDDT